MTLTHRNILNNGYFLGKAMRLTADDRICIPVPLYHCFGMVMGNLAALTSGAAMVFPGEGFDPRATLAAVAEERCTALYGVPTMFIAQPDRRGTPSHAATLLGALSPAAGLVTVIDAIPPRCRGWGACAASVSPRSASSASARPATCPTSTVTTGSTPIRSAKRWRSCSSSARPRRLRKCCVVRRGCIW